MRPGAPSSLDPATQAPHRLLDAYYATEDEKKRFIRRIFDDTAGDYDRVDRVLALGTGSWYRRQALIRAGLKPGAQILDVATGTGLLAREMQRLLQGSGSIIGIDPSAGMLSAGAQPLAIPIVRGRAEELPFAAAQFDFVGLGFALRHVENLAAVFGEFRRVLRPGGRLLILEITRAESRLGNALLRAYMRGVVPLVSRIVARHGDTPRLYRYYWDTIEACAPPARVMASLREAGFTHVDRHAELGIFSEYRATA